MPTKRKNSLIGNVSQIKVEICFDFMTCAVNGWSTQPFEKQEIAKEKCGELFYCFSNKNFESLGSPFLMYLCNSNIIFVLDLNQKNKSIESHTLITNQSSPQLMKAIP